MSEITKDEAIKLYEEYSKHTLSSIKFKSKTSTYKFSPSGTGIGVLNFAFVFVLLLPHVLFYFGKFGTIPWFSNILYVVFTTVIIFVVFFLSRVTPTDEILVDILTQEIKLKPKDLIGRFLKKPLVIKIDTISEIKNVHYKTKHGGEANIVVDLKDGSSYNMFALKDYDNVSKFTAAFSAIVFNRPIDFDESKEPSVIIDKKLKKLIKENVGETSNLPIVLFLVTLAILIIGAFLNADYLKMKAFSEEVDSLLSLKLKILGIALAVYAIPLVIAATTAHQKKSKNTKSILIVFGLMAIGGFYMLISGLVTRLNMSLDESKPPISHAIGIESRFHPKSGKVSSFYILTFKIDKNSKEIQIEHHDREFHENATTDVKVYLHKGYFNKRWVEVIH